MILYIAVHVLMALMAVLTSSDDAVAHAGPKQVVPWEARGAAQRYGVVVWISAEDIQHICDDLDLSESERAAALEHYTEYANHVNRVCQGMIEEGNELDRQLRSTLLPPMLEEDKTLDEIDPERRAQVKLYRDMAARGENVLAKTFHPVYYAELNDLALRNIKRAANEEREARTALIDRLAEATGEDGASLRPRLGSRLWIDWWANSPTAAEDRSVQVLSSHVDMLEVTRSASIDDGELSGQRVLRLRLRQGEAPSPFAGAIDEYEKAMSIAVPAAVEALIQHRKARQEAQQGGRQSQADDEGRTHTNREREIIAHCERYAAAVEGALIGEGKADEAKRWRRRCDVVLYPGVYVRTRTDEMFDAASNVVSGDAARCSRLLEVYSEYSAARSDARRQLAQSLVEEWSVVHGQSKWQAEPQRSRVVDLKGSMTKAEADAQALIMGILTEPEADAVRNRIGQHSSVAR